jgi:menaquinone-9 beta-reductase
VFFAGDSAGHCLPLTAEGIRTALYFGLSCARELRAVHEGRITRERALARYGAFSDRHARKYRWLLNAQRTIGRLMPTPAPTALTWGLQSRRFANWMFEHYLGIAPPSFVAASPRRSPSAAGRVAAPAAL